MQKDFVANQSQPGRETPLQKGMEEKREVEKKQEIEKWFKEGNMDRKIIFSGWQRCNIINHMQGMLKIYVVIQNNMISRLSLRKVNKRS